VKEALQNGARLIIGGMSHAMGENFYEPTLICDVRTDMRVCEEEIFGPVATMVKFEREEQVLEMANSCRNGLAGLPMHFLISIQRYLLTVFFIVYVISPAKFIRIWVNGSCK